MPTSHPAQTRPTHVAPQTLAQAKRAYASNGPRLSSQQSRQLERGAELYQRAEKIKEAEKRKKQNAKRKAEREQRERESRRRMGIPSPSREVKKVSASQGLLTGFTRVVGMYSVRKEEKGRPKMEAENEDEGEDTEVEDYMDDILDDTSLLEAVAEEPPVAAISRSFAAKQDKSSFHERQHASVAKPTTSFTENTDFVLAREITWTQDIEAAKSFDAIQNGIPVSASPKEMIEDALSKDQESWEDFFLSNTQIDQELAITPPPRCPKVLQCHPICVPQQNTAPAPISHQALNPCSPSAQEQDPCQASAVNDTLFSLLSTQDLSFSSPFSSPNFVDSEPLGLPTTSAHKARYAPSATLEQNNQTSNAAAVVPPPAQILNTDLMPPPPRPRPAPNPSTTATKMMPPPPPPKGAFGTPLSPPARPLSKSLPEPLYLQPTKHVYAHPPISRPQLGVADATNWIPFDFDISTQDCREIDVG